MNNKDVAGDLKGIWNVLKTEPENGEITSLYLEGDDEKFKKRRAGQYASIRIPREDGWSELHPFTISCAPEDKILRLTIKKGGAFTSSIPNLKPGTPVKTAGPFGVFCKDIDTKEDIAMFAGGVGITPFLSVLRHFKTISAKNLIILFWTNRTIDDTFSMDELNEMTKALNLRIVHTLSREKEVEKHLQTDAPKVLYLTGYATRALMQEYINFPDTSFYLCGPPKMQEFVLGELEACGIDPKSVGTEKFSYEKGH